MTLLFIGFCGLFFGSFLNVLADRLSFGRTLTGRSKCDSCKHSLYWNDLIPIISFLALHGKCRYCRASFSLQYPLSELFTAGMFALTWYFSSILFRSPIVHVIHLGIVSVLIVMLLADLRYQIIPDEMQIALFILGLVNILFVPVMIHMPIVQILQTVGIQIVYGVAVMAPLLAVFLFTRGKGMGFGDVKLAFCIGFILGLLSGYIALYIGFVTGGLIGGLMLLFKMGKLKTKIAFGPFLLLGLYCMMFFENDIILLLGKIYHF